MPAMQLATYEDVLAVEHPLTAQLIDGELFVSPRPRSRHAKVAGLLLHLLAPYWRGSSPGGWQILFEPELHIGDPEPRSRVLVPDMAGWRAERMDAIPDVAAFHLVPDWVCEVLSPSTARWDRIKKMAVYAEAGVRTVWIVDPAAHTVEVYHLVDGTWTRPVAVDGDSVVRLEPFDAVEIELGECWISA